jgi:hypothetical protein
MAYVPAPAAPRRRSGVVRAGGETVRHTMPMSCTSRPRGEGTRSTTRRTDLVVVPDPTDDCDCLACTGGDLDLGGTLDELLEGVATLADCFDATRFDQDAVDLALAERRPRR